MPRVVSLFLPTWSTDRLRRTLGGAALPAEAPLVLIGREGRRRVVLAADRAALRAGRESAMQPRLVAPGGVPMDDAFARHPVDERNGLLQRRFGGSQVVAVDGRADAPERAAQVRAELAVALAVLETLTMRLERGCMRSHVNSYLRNH